MRTTFRLAVIAALALGLSGCDKCGNWFGQSTPRSCSSDMPR